MKLILATFGSAPVTSPCVTDLLSGLPEVATAVSFVNERDMVTRADHHYVRCVVDLYRAGYGLLSTSAITSQPSLIKEKTETKYRVDLSELKNPADADIRPHWDLPLPVYYLVGEIVVLRSNLNLSPVSQSSALDSQSNTETLTGASLSAIQLSALEFGNLLFCDIGVHKRRVYLDRMRKLATRFTRLPSGV